MSTANYPTDPPTKLGNLWTAIIMLSVVMAIGFGYLVVRHFQSDHEQQVQRKAVCSVIDEIPAGRDVGVDTARYDDRCGPAHPEPQLVQTPKPSPASTVTITARPKH